MKRLKKLSAGLLLTLGLMFLMVPVYVLTKEDATEQDQADAMGGLVLGVPVVAWGGWLMRQLSRQGERESRDRLHSTFYHLLKEGKGNVTVIRLAMEAEVSAATAEQYLNEKAREFDADFLVSDEGSICYHFLL
ncbi:MAG: hypothetical protein KME06_00975 [Kastovskya adunca ATA6-11-RM4]|jgi:large subunit ribosomal protein L7/L12|nr:hypothetical protein [Kastovskya adunca ATA6-11-RM4]